MITKKLFVDTRTGEVKTQFSILDIKYMRELKEDDIVNNTKKEVEKLLEKEHAFRKLHGFE